MEKKEFQCPKCDVLMEARRCMGRIIYVCGTCDGVLLMQKDLMHILKEMFEDLSRKVDFTGVVKSVPDENLIVACPGCMKDMEQFGYMGTQTVIIDNCLSCGFIFVDKYELSAMAVMNGDWEQDHKRVSASKDNPFDVLAVAVLNSYALY